MADDGMRASKKRAALRQPGRQAPTLRRGKVAAEGDADAPTEGTLDEDAFVVDVQPVTTVVDGAPDDEGVPASAGDDATVPSAGHTASAVASVFGDAPVVDTAAAAPVVAVTHSSPVLDPKRRVR